MNILYCGDKNTKDGLLISIMSLMKNVREPLNIYILTADITHGGKHYEQVEFAHKTYTDSIGNIIAPYDYPKMPYEKDGVIYVLCGQGADGDYDGGDSLHLARYRSEDHGHSFVFDTLVDGTSEG